MSVLVFFFPKVWKHNNLTLLFWKQSFPFKFHTSITNQLQNIRICKWYFAFHALRGWSTYSIQQISPVWFIYLYGLVWFCGLRVCLFVLGLAYFSWLSWFTVGWSWWTTCLSSYVLRVFVFVFLFMKLLKVQKVSITARNCWVSSHPLTAKVCIISKL